MMKLIGDSKLPRGVKSVCDGLEKGAQQTIEEYISIHKATK